MSQFGPSLSKPVLVLAGMGYFVLLCLALILLHLPPEDILALTIAGVGLILMSLRPYFGAHIFILTLFVENAFGESKGISPMQVIGGVILAGWLVNLVMQRKTDLKFHGFTVLLSLFLLWSCISLVFAVNTHWAAIRTFTYAQSAVAALMFSAVVDTPDRLRRIYWSFLICATASTVVAVAMYYQGLTPNASGLVGNRNLLACYINIAIVCAYLLFQGTKSNLSRSLIIAALPMLFLGIGLTFSRAGLIVLMVTLVVLWYRVARQRKFLLLAGSVGMICLLTYLLPNTFWERAGSIVPAIRQEQRKDTFTARLRLWTVAGRMIRDRPVFGVGPGNFVEAFPWYARGNERMFVGLVTHNAYVGVTTEHGLVGGLLFLLILGYALYVARQSSLKGRAMARSDLEIVAIVVEVSLLVIFLSGLSGNVETSKCLWMFLGLAIAIQQMAARTVPEMRPSGAADPADVTIEGVVPWAWVRPRQ